MTAPLFPDGIALVTGAGSGIGRATAELFAAEGAAGVVIGDIDAASAEETAEIIRATGVKAVAARADVGDPQEMAALVDLAASTFGRLDAAVNNAGVRGIFARIGEYGDEDWSQVVRVNLDGVFYGVRAEVNQMQRQAPGGGAIVNIASGATWKIRAQLPAYVATKTGVIGITKVAAKEYAPDGIRVNVVGPGRTRTPMMMASVQQWGKTEAEACDDIPMGRFADPNELAQAIVWLCSPRSSYVTGQVLYVDGGQTL